MAKKKTIKKSRAKLIEEMSDRVIAEVMKDLPNRMRKQIEASILSLLGLSTNYGGRAEVDHCNGRWNMFADIIKAEAAKDVVEIVRDIKQKYNFEQFKGAFQTEYNNHFRYRMKYEAERKAKAFADKYIDEKLKELIPLKIEEKV